VRDVDLEMGLSSAAIAIANEELSSQERALVVACWVVAVDQVQFEAHRRDAPLWGHVAEALECLLDGYQGINERGVR
jgi:hypothetical protein